MTLTPGTRIGPYEVLSSLGAGGMGEVYRATDTKLKRQVAIKILPPSVAADHDRLARFQREAEVLASLNHPHIAGIYGLEESEGVSALVMELVEGEDLSTLIASGTGSREPGTGLPIDEALAIAKQIAEALEAAHEQGIIHRDLKPANIKVRSDGTVKVLDFGLAKAMEQGSGIGDQGSGGLANSPTITSPAMTMRGVILGTAAYMAPEQAKGKPVDKRADIWAFGVVLYEMLAGRRAFEGEDVSDLLVAVLSKDVDLRSLPAGTPSSIVALIRRCLARDPKKRLRDIGEARLILENPAVLVPDDLSSAIPVAAPAAPVWLRALPWAIVAALAVVAVLLWSPWRAETTMDRPLVRLDVDLGADVSLPAFSAYGSNVAISPDGTRLAFVSGRAAKLSIRRLDQQTATELAGTEGAQGPFFSPDGQWIGFMVRGKLNKISVEGGAVVAVADVANAVGGSWSEDGSIIVGSSPGSRGLLRIPADGGAPELIAPMAAGEVALARPQILPGGKAVLFTAAANDSADINKFTVEVLTLADHQRKIVARGGSTARYLSTSAGMGHLVYTNNATLFAIPFDLEKLETRGTAIPVLDDVAYDVNLGVGGFEVSRTGTLVYRRAGARAAAMSTLQWVDAAGKYAPLQAAPGFYGQLHVSPDGARVALLSYEAGFPSVWVYEVPRDAMTRLTFARSAMYAEPIWTPDGQYVVFGDTKSGSIYSTRADGASQLTTLVTGEFLTVVPWSIAPDGKRLAYFGRSGANFELWTAPIEVQGGQLKAGTPEAFLKSSFDDRTPSFSPDGRWLAYASNESGQFEVYVRAFPPSSSGPAGKWQISNTGGIEPHWSGRDLMYRSGDQIMAASYTVKGDTFVAEKPRVWIAKLGAAAGLLGAWDPSHDGKRVAVVTPVESAEALKQEHEVVFLQNFFDELRRRVPPDLR